MKTLTKNFLLCSIFFFTTTLTAQQLHVTNPVGAVQEAVLIDNPANTEGVLILNTAAANPLPALQARSAGTGEAVHGENTLSGASLFGLKQGAATGRAGLFANMNATNPSPTLQSITNGLGRAGQFQNTNAANVSAALSASTNSPGPAIEGINNAAGPSIEGVKILGTGPAGIFFNAIPGNMSAALIGLSIGGPAVEAINDGVEPSLLVTKRVPPGPGVGTGPAAVIENTNAANMMPTLVVTNVNTALPALSLDVMGNTSLMGNTTTKNIDIINDAAARPAAVITNTMTAHPGLHIVQDDMGGAAGLSPGLLIDQKSDGEAASIAIMNATNGTDALTASTDGTGSAGSFSATNAGNASSSLIGIHDGPGAGVEGANTAGGHSVLGTKGAGATGHAGHFENFDATNPDPTLKVINANLDPAAFALDVDGNAKISGDVCLDSLFANIIRVDSIHADILTASVKSFMIKHPLDPENKFLRHCSIESDEMLNIYTGNVVLDKKGKATVALPDWFEALNKDFRYNLTCIGGFAKVYVAKEIKNGKFQVAGGRKGMKVSWQVSGVRHDQFANEHPLHVEGGK